jgi:competence protein ComEA
MMPDGGEVRAGARGANAVGAKWRCALVSAAMLYPAALFCAGLLCAAQATQAPPRQPAPGPAARVDINHATLEELLKIPGMTATWAARIVRFRPYRTRQDLLDKGVVTSQVFDRIKDYVIAHRDRQ